MTYNQQYCNNLLSQNRLILIVDLERILLSSVYITEKTSGSTLPPDCHIVTISKTLKWCIKLRPNLIEFLTTLSSMFELQLWTRCPSIAVQGIIKIIDRNNSLFGDRIKVAKSAFNKWKVLQTSFPEGNNIVCALDDDLSQWNKEPNVVHVRPYDVLKMLHALAKNNPTLKFFDRLSSFVDTDNELAHIVNILRNAHCLFFQRLSQNVTQCPLISNILQEFRYMPMRECRILDLTGSIDVNIYNFLVEFTATNYTHVLVNSDLNGTVKNAHKHAQVVDKRWLFDCYYRFQRIPESDYVPVEIVDDWTMDDLYFD